jgi:8-amino-7-oxononanoate synthase
MKNELMINFYSSALQNLKKNNLYRQLTSSNAIGEVNIQRGEQTFVSFCCNDYLGLSQNQLVKKAAMDAIEKYGVGARASRYVTGNNALYHKLEQQIAHMKKADDGIVFASGYAGAVGVIPALVGKGDLIVADKLIHASLIDGSKLSGAKLMRFLHNDMEHCRKILEENREKFGKCVIVTETVFSMDGDLGKVDALLALAQEFDALLISDDAHGLHFGHESADGVTKPELSRSQSRLLQMGTFSKAVGSLGGYVVGEAGLIDYLRNFARTGIYSTALPPSVLAASLQALHIIEKENLGRKALENAAYFCQLMDLPKPDSAIVPIMIGDNAKVLKIAQKVQEDGFVISAIRPPTVEAGKARLRVTFSALHTSSQISQLSQSIALHI